MELATDPKMPIVGFIAELSEFDESVAADQKHYGCYSGVDYQGTRIFQGFGIPEAVFLITDLHTENISIILQLVQIKHP